MKKYAIYLHTNGQLIRKPEFVYQSDPEYFSSPFIKKVWYINPQTWSIQEYIQMLQEAKDLGASKESLKEYLDDWSLNKDY